MEVVPDSTLEVLQRAALSEDQPGVPFDNNHAERIIRPAVIIRKNS